MAKYSNKESSNELRVLVQHIFLSFMKLVSDAVHSHFIFFVDYI